MARFLEGDTEADPRPSPLAPVEDRGKGRPPKRTRAHARSSAAMLQAADAEVDHAVHQRAAKRARQAHEHGDADSEESESDLSPSPARGMALLRDSRLERASVAGAVQPTDVVIGDATTREHKAPPVEKSPDSEATPVCLPREPAQPSAGAFRGGHHMVTSFDGDGRRQIRIQPNVASATPAAVPRVQHAVGSAVEVYSTTKEQWCQGLVTHRVAEEISSFAPDAQRDQLAPGYLPGFRVTAGSIRVQYGNKFKWFAPRHFESHVRLVG